MKTPDLQRTAYTVECFLNALRLEDGPERTKIEETLVRWLADPTRLKEDHLLYSQGNIACYSQGKPVHNFAVPQAKQAQTIWSNDAKLSTIDGCLLYTSPSPRDS